MGTLTQLLLAALAVSALVVVLCVSLAVIRAGRIQLERRRARLAGPLRPALLSLAAGDDGTAADRLAGLDPRRWRALEPGILALIAKVRGGARAELIGVLRRRGAYERALGQAGSRRALRRAGGADRLGLLGDPDAAPRIIELLGDRSPQVRRVAARAASRLPSPQVAAALLGCLGGRRPVPPRIVAQALLRIGPPAVPVLQAAAGVYAAGDPAAASAAGDPARAAGPAPGDRAAAVAVDVLGLMRSRESAPALLAALRHGPDEARIRAARALGRIGSPAAVGPLVDATAAEQARSLRIVALGALASIGDRRLAPQLAALLADADGRVAQAAARALAALGEPGEEALRQAAGAPASCQPADGLGSGACQAAAELGPGSRAALHARSALATVDLARERAGRRGRAS